MLLDSLTALVLAGDDVLQTTCGLSVTDHAISLVRQGSLTFPALGEVHIKGGPLQKIHLGCDSLLCGQLAGLVSGDKHEAGIEVLANRFLQQVISEMEGRNPRGSVQRLDVGPINLVSRGLRSFGIRLETGVGQLFILAEVPSRMELELAKNSEYLTAMEATYLPKDWGTRQSMDSQLAIDNFLVFLRKVEGDVYFEVPGQDDVHYLHNGILLDNGTFEGVRGLKFCTDLAASGDLGLKRGDMVRSEVGIGERSLQFSLRYLGESSHPLVNGAELPCAFFELPEKITISQRRLAFRIPVQTDIAVDIYCGDGANNASPWSDSEQVTAPLFSGTLADLSFGGARIVADEISEGACLDINRQVVCDIHFPEMGEPLTLVGVVRRNSSRLIDRNERQHEVGLEFVLVGEEDRASLEYIRQFVLSEQRSRLAKRIHVGGIST